MRLSGGKFKGHALAAPKQNRARPTSAKTRAAIFDLIEHAVGFDGWEERSVLDLFAGSGALGFEALSRGAAFCAFVDIEAASRSAIRVNIEKLQLYGCTALFKRDAKKLGRRPPRMAKAANIVFMDPPYGLGILQDALNHLAGSDWLALHPWVVIESEAGLELPRLDGLEILKQKKYGATQITLLRQTG